MPWIALRFSGWHGEPLAVAAVLVWRSGAAFLSRAAEVAQMDISQSLALAFLALISISAGYAVDMVFARKAGKELALPLAQQQGYAGLAAANMTGANRLLIGLGWSAVVLITGRAAGIGQ